MTGRDGDSGKVGIVGIGLENLTDKGTDQDKVVDDIQYEDFAHCGFNHRYCVVIYNELE